MRSVQRLASQAITIAVILALWQLGSGRLFDTYWYSKPSLIGARLVQMAGQGTLSTSVAATFGIMFAGFALGGVTGIACGLLLGLKSRLALVLAPFVTAVYSIPLLALVPLFILWLGIYTVSKVTIVAIVVFFLFFYNTFTGVTEVDRDLILNVDLLGASRRWIVRRVILPSSGPWILAGARVALPYALVSAVAAEMMISTGGMGSLLMKSSAMIDSTGTFTVLAVLMILAVALDQCAELVSQRLLRWRQPHR